jgi:hypothetical protein
VAVSAQQSAMPAMSGVCSERALVRRKCTQPSANAGFGAAHDGPLERSRPSACDPERFHHSRAAPPTGLAIDPPAPGARKFIPPCRAVVAASARAENVQRRRANLAQGRIIALQRLNETGSFHRGLLPYSAPGCETCRVARAKPFRLDLFGLAWRLAKSADGRGAPLTPGRGSRQDRLRPAPFRLRARGRPWKSARAP